MPEKTKLSPDEILRAEFEYISSTIFAANEDRARVTSFYLLIFSSFIAAIVSYQFNTNLAAVWMDGGFSVLFFSLAIMGLLTIIQLGRIRVAWYDSVQALNQIKDYYIEHNPGIEKAFAWRSITAQKFKPNSIGFMLVIQVAILAGTAMGVSIFFAARALSGDTWLTPAVVAAIAFMLWQLDLYRSYLK